MKLTLKAGQYYQVYNGDRIEATSGKTISQWWNKNPSEAIHIVGDDRINRTYLPSIDVLELDEPEKEYTFYEVLKILFVDENRIFYRKDRKDYLEFVIKQKGDVLVNGRDDIFVVERKDIDNLWIEVKE
jgi:hypothetical protein